MTFKLSNVSWKTPAVIFLQKKQIIAKNQCAPEPGKLPNKNISRQIESFTNPISISANVSFISGSAIY